jgi:hypothetical protein
MINRVLITERGWPGHFILGSRCVWHRNTLLEHKVWGSRTKDVFDEWRRVVVSSVGRCYIDKESDTPMILGIDGRVMETMVFLAEMQPPFWEANTSRQQSKPDGMEWCSDDWSHGASATYERIHNATVKWWEGAMGGLVDREWHELTKRSDE